MQPRNNISYRLLFRARRLLARIVLWLASFWTRLSVLGVAVALVLYLLYAQVWVSFTREAELPVGITPTNPEINASLLNDINTQRTQRVQEKRPDFRAYSNVFVPVQSPRSPL